MNTHCQLHDHPARGLILPTLTIGRPTALTPTEPPAAAKTAPPAAGDPSGWIGFLDDLVGNGGPEPADYTRLNRCFASLAHCLHVEGPTSPLVQAARTILAPVLHKATLLGHLHLRPHGYPGDYELIERILSYHHSTDPNLVRWDMYAHALPAARALRNRAAHLRERLLRLESADAASPARILSYRSGPGRDLADFFIARGTSTALRADCVDPDPNAAPHGRRNVARMTDRMTFHTTPLLRFRSQARYRLAWSSGLCEGVSDRELALVVRQLLGLLEPGGRMVLCQLAGPDASTPVLEWLTGWRPMFRSTQDLVSLALQAGASPDTVRVEHDPQYPNLFLHVTRPLALLRRRPRLRQLPGTPPTPALPDRTPESPERTPILLRPPLRASLRRAA